MKHSISILCSSILLFAASVSAQPTINDDNLRMAESRGMEIYIRDALAASATDLVTVGKLQSANVSGWITIGDGDNWVVRFLKTCDGGVCSVFDVTFNLEQNSANLVELEKPETISDEQLSLWKARQLALASDFRACSTSYNTVVLPRSNDEDPALIVYLLAATTEPNVIVLGGHHKITISADGEKIIESNPLSKSCLNLEPSRNATALTITHLLTAEPLETHVFSSLLYQTPIYVGTDAGIFAVEGNQIRIVQRDRE
ncbi:MAG: hypothetical protein WEA82_03380 [Idiomarina sp.]